MLMLASVMPFDTMIKLLEEEIAEHKLNPSEESQKRISMSCMLIASKSAIDSTGGLEKTMKDMERMRDGYDLLSPKAQ
jgi:hypothetical protein